MGTSRTDLAEVSEGSGYFVPLVRRNKVVDQDLSKGEYRGSDEALQ